jgi:hypothetical protein
MQIQLVSSGYRWFDDRIFCDSGCYRHFENGAEHPKINQQNSNKRRLTLSFHLIAITISDMFRYSRDCPQSHVQYNLYSGQPESAIGYKKYR